MILTKHELIRVICLVSFCAGAIQARGSAAIVRAQDVPASNGSGAVAGEHLQRAKEAYDKANYSRTKAEIKRALALKTDMPEAYVLLGMTHWQEGRHSKAVEQIEKALQYRPNYSDAYYYLSIIHWKEGELPKAREAIDLAIKNGTASFDLYVLRAQIALSERDYDLAVNSFTDAARFANRRCQAFWLTQPDRGCETIEGLSVVSV